MVHQTKLNGIFTTFSSDFCSKSKPILLFVSEQFVKAEYHCCFTSLSLVCRRRFPFNSFFFFFFFAGMLMCVKNCFQNKRKGKTQFHDTRFFTFFYGNATGSLSHNQMKT